MCKALIHCSIIPSAGKETTWPENWNPVRLCFKSKPNKKSLDISFILDSNVTPSSESYITIIQVVKKIWKDKLKTTLHGWMNTFLSISGRGSTALHPQSSSRWDGATLAKSINQMRAVRRLQRCWGMYFLLFSLKSKPHTNIQKHLSARRIF